MNKKKIQTLFKNLVNDDYRYYIQMIIIPLFIGLTSLVMFIMNIITHKTLLIYITLIFALISFANSFLTYMRKEAGELAYSIFEISIIILFTSFLITGGTEGFSPIWICILPCCGLLLLGQKRGSFVCGIMLAIIIFLLWIPFGKGLLLYQYTNEFCMRFPFVYCCFFVIGYLFELIRFSTNQELKKTQKKYMELSIKDTLTDLYNRYWFNNKFDDFLNNDDKPFGIVMFDIDFFKSINDKYGHTFGDYVLKKIGEVLKNKISGNNYICRWGGEEFLAFFDCNDPNLLVISCEDLRQSIENLEIIDSYNKKVKITISIGAVFVCKSIDISQSDLFDCVDIAMYKAKNNGRNCIVLDNY